MIPVKTVISIGLKEPVRLLHLSDTHFCYADDRDETRVQELAARRREAFEGDDTGRIERHWAEAIAYAGENGMPILHTGDLMDFLSHGNVVRARAALDGVDCFFAAGNHEFCRYVGEAKEDLPYKMESLPMAQSAFSDPLLFASRVIGGVNFVAVDNGYYLFTDWQRERLEYEVGKGLPVVLMMHNPIHTDELYDVMMNERKQPCAYLTGTPNRMMACYPDHRYRQQLPDEATRRFIEYIAGEKSIRAVLAGHLHFNWEGKTAWGVPQIVTGGGFAGDAREITFI